MRIRPSLGLAAALLAAAAACGDTGTPDGERPGGTRAEMGTAELPGEQATAPSPRPSPHPSPHPSPSPSPSPVPVRAPFDPDRALGFATALAEQVGARPAGTPASRQARDRVATGLADAGWTVSHVPVELPQGGRSANVVAWLGPARRAGGHVVIGAHYDTVADSPGANDNASGVGTLVALAEELADEPGPVPVVFVAFAAEEYQPSEPRRHHIGSRAYAGAHGDDVIAMVSLDMLGNGQSTCICWFDAGPSALAERLRRVAADAGLDGFHVAARGDISDHGPFARRGVPAAFLWTGDDGRFHTSADTAEHLDVADLRRAGRLTLAFVRSLGRADLDGVRPGS